jgi:hypothetical protein
MRFAKLHLFPCLIFGVAACGVPAYAQVLPSAPELAPQTSDLYEPAPLAETELSAISAGDDVTHNVVSSQELNATNSGNSVTAGTVQSGNINFSGNALTGFSGVGNFVSNTGNNNNLQGSISINITGLPGTQ